MSDCRFPSDGYSLVLCSQEIATIYLPLDLRLPTTLFVGALNLHTHTLKNMCYISLIANINVRVGNVINYPTKTATNSRSRVIAKYQTSLCKFSNYIRSGI